MYTNRLIKFALKQTAIILAVLLSIPIVSGTALLLLSMLAAFLCSQLSSTMILAVVLTAALAARQFRTDTPPESAMPDQSHQASSGITCFIQTKEIVP